MRIIAMSPWRLALCALVAVAASCGGGTSDSDSESEDPEADAGSTVVVDSSPVPTSEGAPTSADGASASTTEPAPAPPTDRYEPPPDTPEPGGPTAPPDGPQPQTIDFPPPGENHIWPDNEVELQAQASSGLAVEYRIEDDTGVCVLDGSTLRVQDQLGGCTVVAGQAGDDDYLPAEDVAQNYYVGGQRLTVDVSDVPESPSASATPTVTVTAVVTGDAGVPFSADLTISSLAGDCSTDDSVSITDSTPQTFDIDLSPPGIGSCTVQVGASGQYVIGESVDVTFNVAP